MEQNIIAICLISFLLYFIVQVLLLKRVKRSMNSLWQIRMLFLFTLLPAVLMGTVAIMNHISVSFAVIYGLLTAVIIGLFLVIYLLTVYSYLESSITVKLFMLIADSQNRYVTEKNLHTYYSKQAIIRRRLERFVAIGQIRKEKNKYYAQTETSVFNFRSAFHHIFCFFFPLE